MTLPTQTAAFAQGDTIAAVDNGFADWRAGRRDYAVWAIDVDVPWLRMAVSAARSRLDGLLHGGYARQPHVTLCAGGFTDGDGSRDDDLPEAVIRAQAAAIRDAAIGNFALGFEGVGSFSTAPYIAVHDPNQVLAQLHDVLCAHWPVSRMPAFVPHCTVGHYRVVTPMAEVARRTQGFRLPDMRITVSGIALMRFDAAELAGPLTQLQAVPLSAA